MYLLAMLGLVMENCGDPLISLYVRLRFGFCGGVRERVNLKVEPRVFFSVTMGLNMNPQTSILQRRSLET